MKVQKVRAVLFIIVFLAGACGRHNPGTITDVNSLPRIYPDYIGVTLPPRIAPPDFTLPEECNRVWLTFSGNGYSTKLVFEGNKVIIPEKKWKKLLALNTGKCINVEIIAQEKDKFIRYRPFRMFVAEDPADEYMVYRNLMPGFQNWNQMGIYQRSLDNFRVTTILDSRLMPGTCMNCHSFAGNNPDNMVLHLRESYGGTILYHNGQLEKLNTRTDRMFANAAFPSWHPSGNYIAFSVNRVNQVFHASGPYRATAIDLNSDIVLYDIRKHEMKIPGNLSRDDRLETFPAFSPDGSTLYYCSADTHRLPAKYREMKYSLYAVSFDQATGESGTVPDTVIKASVAGRSISIPRMSPDGRFLMFNVADYGAFPSYNPEADIWMMDLRSRKIYPLDSLNSSDVESYHSWSSNGRWVAFSSRRNDKLYSNIYLAYIDSNGIARKPFLLPQKDPEFYNKFLYSFNVPEFAVKPVGIGPYQLEKAARSRNFIQVQTGSSH